MTFFIYNNRTQPACNYKQIRMKQQELLYMMVFVLFGICYSLPNKQQCGPPKKIITKIH